MFKIDIENTSDLNAAIPPLKEVSENRDEKGDDKEDQTATAEPEQGSGALESEDDKSERVLSHLLPRKLKDDIL